MSETAATLWFVNATQDHAALPAVCEQARKAGQAIHVLHRHADREAVLGSVPAGDGLVRLVEMAEGSFRIPGVHIEDNAEVFFLPCSARIDWDDLRQRAHLSHPDCIQPLFAMPPKIASTKYLTGPLGWWGWRAGGELARRILKEPAAWDANGVGIIETIQHWPDPPRWQSIPLHVPGGENYLVTSPPVLTMSSSVLVVISFYRCEEWLHACLTCMTQQTRPPENIVVIDDCSPALPAKFVEAFPTVTLLSTTRNAGPEKILNNIIRATDYDAYMLQDPDDWSSHDRLEFSLRGAERTGADLVGTHEFRVDLPRKTLELCLYPPDVNYAMSQGIAHHLLHCTSLISRGLAMRVGGFDEHLKLAADTDFIARAWHAGRIVNLPGFCFFRRVRPGSLTTTATTGYHSKARMLEDRFIQVRGTRHLELARAGKTPDVFVKHTEPLGFHYHQGPKLRLSDRGLSA